MKTYSTYREYLADCTEKAINSHRPPAIPYMWKCADCGQTFPHSDSYGLNGRDDAAKMVCYACCYLRDIEQLKDRTKPFCAYLSCDSTELHNWPGKSLGRVCNLSSSRSGWNGTRIYRFNVCDVHGQWWSGRGAGAGMFCTIRPMKTPRGY